MEIIDLFTENWEHILAVFGGLNVVIRVVVTLTPNKADDRWYNRVVNTLYKVVAGGRYENIK